MIFISSYPRVTGASDLEDSSHLAGMLAIMEHPSAIPCKQYIFVDLPLTKNSTPIYKRCPDSKYDFSRDQFILLAAGLIKQKYEFLVKLKYITGRDILPPSVRGLVRIAQGKKPYWLQSIWLKGEIYWHSYLQPLEEPNQIMALCSVYGDEYLKLWVKHNKLWKWSIRRYWSELDGAWRAEPELAEHIINYVNSKVLG